MPHIDPLKEAKSIELMLALNLISHEQASEMLGVGSWDENYKKLTKEKEILPKEVVIAPSGNTTSKAPKKQ